MSHFCMKNVTTNLCLKHDRSMGLPNKKTLDAEGLTDRQCLFDAEKRELRSAFICIYASSN